MRKPSQARDGQLKEITMSEFRPLLAAIFAAALLCAQAQQASALIGPPSGGAAAGGGGGGGGPAIGVIAVATYFVVREWVHKSTRPGGWKCQLEDADRFPGCREYLAKKGVKVPVRDPNAVIAMNRIANMR